MVQISLGVPSDEEINTLCHETQTAWMMFPAVRCLSCITYNISQTHSLSDILYAQGTNIFFKSRFWVTFCMSIKLKAQSRLHNWTTLRISSSETAAEVKWSTFSGFSIVTNISVQWSRTEEERLGEIRVRWWSHSSYASCLAPLSLSSGALRPDSAAEPGCFVWLIWSRGVRDEGAIGKLESIPALNTYPLPPVGRCFPFCLTLCVCLFSVCIEDEARESAVLVVVSSVGFSTIQFDVNFVPCVQMEDDAVRGVVIVLVGVLGNSTGTNLEHKKPFLNSQDLYSQSPDFYYVFAAQKKNIK